MAEIGVTEVTASSQEIVSSIVQETLKQRSILLPAVVDYSSFAQPGVDQVKIPRRTQFAAANKTENTALTAQEMTFSVDTINLNLHKAIYAELERIAGVQNMVNTESEIIKEMAAELALQVDKDLITQLKAVSTAAPDHLLDYADTVGDVIAATDILEARRLLNVQNVPQEDRFMLISPTKEKEMLSIANFIEVDKYGPNDAISNAELGRIYGFRVLMHTELSAAESLFWHRSHVGYASQLDAEFKKDQNLSKVADEYLLHKLYGTLVLDGGKRGVFFNGTGV